jgi:cation diffusion facilitator family transporter
METVAEKSIFPADLPTVGRFGCSARGTMSAHTSTTHEIAVAIEDASTRASAPAPAPAPEVVSFIRSDGSSTDAAALLRYKQAEAALQSGRMPSRLQRFYKMQNELIDDVVADTKILVDEDGHRSRSSASWMVSAALNGSFALNVMLLMAKVVAAVMSGSVAAIASTADSLLDLVSGVIMMLTQRAMARKDPYKYPEGKARLEPIGIIVFAAVMGMSSLQIIVEAVRRVVTIYTEGPSLELGAVTIAILCSTVLTKLVAMFLCQFVAGRASSSSVEAYAQDHRNDVLTNTVGVGAIFIAWAMPDHLAVFDPVGAIVIAMYIIASWMSTALEHIAKLAGLAAPPSFVRRLTHLVFSHDERVEKVDTVRAYHFGERFLVEVEIVMQASTPLHESHDVGLTLQHKIEMLEEVERCYVHVDYMVRSGDDHDCTTPISKKTIDGFPHPRQCEGTRSESESLCSSSATDGSMS